MADKVDVDISQGDTWERGIEFTSDGSPTDISGWTIYAAIKDERDDASAVLTDTVTSHDDAANGSTSVGFTASETQGLDTKSYFYDIRFRTDTDEVYTLVEGVFTVDTPISDTS